MRTILLMVLLGSIVLGCQPENLDPNPSLESYEQDMLGTWRLDSTYNHYNPANVIYPNCPDATIEFTADPYQYDNGNDPRNAIDRRSCSTLNSMWWMFYPDEIHISGQLFEITLKTSTEMVLWGGSVDYHFTKL